MNTIRLCKREIERIKELFDTIHTTGNVGFVTLTQHDEDSGIGYELRATFQITHITPMAILLSPSLTTEIGNGKYLRS